MRFVVDECTGPVVARWLLQSGHDVFSVYDDARGVSDDDILQKAFMQNRILITNDKDFGELIFREKKRHKGIVLLRLEDERAENKIKVIEQLLEQYADQIAECFTVVTENAVRIARPESGR